MLCVLYAYIVLSNRFQLQDKTENCRFSFMSKNHDTIHVKFIFQDIGMYIFISSYIRIINNESNFQPYVIVVLIYEL